MAKLSNITYIFNTLKNTKRPLTADNLQSHLSHLHVRTIYRYIKDLKAVAPVFGYEVIESIRYRKRQYTIIKHEQDNGQQDWNADSDQ